MYRHEYIPHESTGAFSRLVLDYLSQEDFFNEFIVDFPSEQSIGDAIKRKKFSQESRIALNGVFLEQYSALDKTSIVTEHIASLLSPDTYTITTAHQPCLLGGPAYVLYKAIHTIVLARKCKEWYPNYHFVPVFYIGSEDNDIDELNHIHWYDRRVQWDTKQQGAVGRMSTEGIPELLTLLSPYFNFKIPHQLRLWETLQRAYDVNHSVAQAFQLLLHSLLGNQGLLVLNPDHKILKSQIKEILVDEILNRQSYAIANNTSKRLNKLYKVQATPRPINLFYLHDGIRSRIDYTDGLYKVLDTEISLDENTLIKEIHNHPERFSPNVILRPVYQETILPNVAWIGGGGELAYWMQLRDVFNYHKVAFPILVLRQSTVILDRHTIKLMQKSDISLRDIWLGEHEYFSAFLKDKYKENLDLTEIKRIKEQLFDLISNKVQTIDITLNQHVSAIQKILTNKIDILENKMSKAIKKKEDVLVARWNNIKTVTHPNQSIQERMWSFLPLYLDYGDSIIDALLEHFLPQGNAVLALSVMEDKSIN